MLGIKTLEPIDYLIMGHITIDLTPEGSRLGGTAIYSAMAAQALGLRAGIVTSWGSELPLDVIGDIPVANFPAEKSTTFENIELPGGRIQTIMHPAPRLDFYHVPEAWRHPRILHIGPIAQEVEPTVVRSFPSALIGVTSQGYMRTWDEKGHVYHTEWPEAGFVLERVGAAIISRHDVDGDEERIEEMAAACPVLAVTDGPEGSVVYWHGDRRRFVARKVEALDPTGAGDIYAAAFFTRLYATRDPWEAGRFATYLATISVTRPGLTGIPTQQEIEASLMEVI